jgi:hypothetical protein
MKKREARELIPVTSYDQVPDDMTEAEFREFWDTHELTEEYLASAPPVSEDDLPPIAPLREYGPITLDFETFRKARWLARQHGVSLEDLIADLVDQSTAAKSYRKQRPEARRDAATETASSAEQEPVRATGS